MSALGGRGLSGWSVKPQEEGDPGQLAERGVRTEATWAFHCETSPPGLALSPCDRGQGEETALPGEPAGGHLLQ